MADIIAFPKIKKLADMPVDTPHFFCQRCDTDKFKIYENSVVHCANCGALIKNVTVTLEVPKDGPTAA